MEKLRAIAIIQNNVKRFKKIFAEKSRQKSIAKRIKPCVNLNNRLKNSKTCLVAY